MQSISFRSSGREGMLDITKEAQKFVDAGKQSEAVCILFTQHTTRGLTINENADPDVKSDMLGFLERLIPQYEPHFKHYEHNSDAHIKSSLVGPSLTIPVSGGKLLLGCWQGIYLCEFDGPRERTVIFMMR